MAKKTIPIHIDFISNGDNILGGPIIREVDPKKSLTEVLNELPYPILRHKWEITSLDDRPVELPPIIHPIEEIRVTQNFVNIDNNMIHEDDSLLSYFGRLCEGGRFSLPVHQKKQRSIHLWDNEIRFEKTLRIPERSDKIYPLPPSFGSFKLYKVFKYKEKVPKDWDEHGYFFTMYQNEALWLRFSSSSSSPMALKIGLGSVNSITGRRLEGDLSIDGEESEQDYIVLPDQPWLDGANSGDGYVRQFVASPLGLGISVEGQVTGREEVGGFTLEGYPSFASGTCGLVNFYAKERHYNNDDKIIQNLTMRIGNFGLDSIYMEDLTTRREPTVKDYQDLCKKLYGSTEECLRLRIYEFTHIIKKIYVMTLTGRTYIMEDVHTFLKVSDLKTKMKSILQIPPMYHDLDLKFIFAGIDLKNDKIIGEYFPFIDEISIHMVQSMRGGGGGGKITTTPQMTRSEEREMGLGLGGKIKQKIYEDPKPSRWNTFLSTGKVHVYILNSLQFKEITGEEPEPPSIRVEDYIQEGLPWFDLYNDDQLHIKGDLEGKIKTVDSFTHILDKDNNENQKPEIKEKDIMMI